jgi:hypothetical protein
MTACHRERCEHAGEGNCRKHLGALINDVALSSSDEGVVGGCLLTQLPETAGNAVVVMTGNRARAATGVNPLQSW